jgi:hypothetical protein
MSRPWCCNKTITKCFRTARSCLHVCFYYTIYVLLTVFSLSNFNKPCNRLVYMETKRLSFQFTNLLYYTGPVYELILTIFHASWIFRVRTFLKLKCSNLICKLVWVIWFQNYAKVNIVSMGLSSTSWCQAAFLYIHCIFYICFAFSII